MCFRDCYVKNERCVSYIFRATLQLGVLTVSLLNVGVFCLLNVGVFLQKVLETPAGEQSAPFSEMIPAPKTIQRFCVLPALCHFALRVLANTLHATRASNLDK